MVEKPQKPIEKPKIFLILAGGMVLVTILTYTFENQLYDISRGSKLFVLLLSGSLGLALFFLTCYRIPRLGLKVLGREAELGYKKSVAKGSVSFNVYKGENTAEEKIQASARKKVRHQRRSFKNQKVNASPNNDAAEKADKP